MLYIVGGGLNDPSHADFVSFLSQRGIVVSVRGAEL